MKKKLYLHVGPHKTGTTLIQKACLDHQQELASQGVIYPNQYLHIFGHHLLKDKLFKRNLSQNEINIINSIDGNVLFSSEDLISLGRRELEYIKDCFSTFDVHVIYTWRRTSLKMYSIWQEVIKHGSSVGFFEYYHDHLAKPGRSYMLSSDQQIERFVNVFGEDNVTIIDYEKSLSDNSLLRDFFSVINCSIDDTRLNSSKTVTSENKALNYKDVEIIRALNFIFEDRYDVVGNHVREQYLILKNLPNYDYLNHLYETLESSLVEITVGDYFIDLKNDKFIVDKFSDLILNYDGNTINKKVSLLSANWLLKPEVQLIMEKLVEDLSFRILPR